MPPSHNLNFTGSRGGFVPLRSFCTIGSIEASDGKYVLNVRIGTLPVAVLLWYGSGSRSSPRASVPRIVRFLMLSFST